MDGNLLILFFTMFGTWAAALIIWWQLQANRLDNFLKSAFSPSHFKARGDIYNAYLALPDNNRSEAFKNKINNDKVLKYKCDREITLFERIGNSLPKIPPFKQKALRWFPHSIIYLWEILSPYIQYRRKITNPRWAEYFIHFASVCLNEILREKNREKRKLLAYYNKKLILAKRNKNNKIDIIKDRIGKLTNKNKNEQIILTLIDFEKKLKSKKAKSIEISLDRMLKIQKELRKAKKGEYWLEEKIFI
jgi:hypothetical protein